MVDEYWRKLTPTEHPFGGHEKKGDWSRTNISKRKPSLPLLLHPTLNLVVVERLIAIEEMPPA